MRRPLTAGVGPTHREFGMAEPLQQRLGDSFERVPIDSAWRTA